MTAQKRRGLLFALVFGLVAAVVTAQYIQRLQQQVQVAQESALHPTPIPMANVLVAAEDLPAQTALNPSLVRVIQVPLDIKHPLAVTSPDQINGKTLEYPVVAGEQILTDKLTTAKPEVGFTTKIPPGMRAVSISVNEVVGTADLINPGDHVDVLVTLAKQDVGKDMTTTVLQDIQVLAVAQTYIGESGDTAATMASLTKSSTPGPDATPGVTPTGPVSPTPTEVSRLQTKTITVAVTPEQAELLVLAEERGQLRLALRPANDQSVSQVPEVTLNTLTNGAAVQAAPANGASTPTPTGR